MSGITGFFHRPTKKCFSGYAQIQTTIEAMQMSLTHRGCDIPNGIFYNEDVALAQTHLCALFTDKERQPVTRSYNGKTYTLVYQGEIYNLQDLQFSLALLGISLETHSEAETLVYGLLVDGISFCSRLNGVFSFAFYDHEAHSLTLVRDRFGIKPLFYSINPIEHALAFASEPKALFCFPDNEPKINRESLGEIFALGPAHTPGKSVYANISEVLPGGYLTIDAEGSIRQNSYWELSAQRHEDSYEDTVAHVQALVEDAVNLQMQSDLPIATFLSGGLDSSIVTSLCASKLHANGKHLDTFSFDFEDSETYFTANSFQPSLDRPYVDQMKAYCNTNHRYFTCTNDHLILSLYEAVDAQDSPCMADVTSSLIYFCKQTSSYSRIILTGECADEVFGGYPWYHRPELISASGFPWSYQMDVRELLLTDRITQAISFDEYSQNAYQNACKKAPRLSDDPVEQRHREINYLNLYYFMQTLLDRMDRAGAYTGLSARVPFADHRIVSYLYNIPWNLKFQSGVKGLLRDASKAWLPDSVRERKKSPFPKTYHPDYERRLGQMLLDMLAIPDHPLTQFVDIQKVRHYLEQQSNYAKPWYGQLMAGPQLLAYYLQVGYWLEKYNVAFNI